MTTSLEILNHCLNLVGERPVTSYDSNHPTALSAKVQIEAAAKEVQSRGWWFNKEYNYTLSPNGVGELLVPSDTLSILPLSPYSYLVQRSSKLYDPINHTFDVDADVECKIVIQLDIADLPEVAATYIKKKAGYDFYLADDGDVEKLTFLDREVLKAWAALQQEELRQSRVNSNNRPVTAYLRMRTKQYGTSYNPTYPGGGNG